MNIFIGCSSRDNIDNIYKESAIKLANFLSLNNHNLICGGADGVMKILKDIFDKNDRKVYLMGVETYYKIDELLPNSSNYNSIKERKFNLINKADIIIFLPGGIGSIDELFTALESKRAMEHNKPIIIANINNYYDNLLKQLEIMYNENFASISDKEYYYIANTIEEIINYIEKIGDNG